METVEDEIDNVEAEAETRRRRGPKPWTVLAAIIALSLGVLTVLSLAGQTVALPNWVRSSVENRLNAGLTEGSLSLGRVELAVGTGGQTEILLRDISLGDPTGAKLADLNLIRAPVPLGALIQGDFEPSSVTLSGAQITVRRDTAGRFTLTYGGTASRRAVDLGRLFDEIETAFDAPALASIDELRAEDLTVTLEDARAGRLWQASNALLRLGRNRDGLSLSLASELFNGTDTLAEVQLSVRSFAGSSRANLGATVARVPAADIADQSPALAYLGVLDAPISGAIRTTIDASGTMDRLAATLDIGQGSLRPDPEAQPIPFDAGRAYFSYDPASQRFVFSDLSVASDLLSVSAAGQAWLGTFDGSWPSTLTGQFSLSEARFLSPEMFADPVEIEDGQADIRVHLDPFQVELGGLSARIGTSRLTARGRAGTGMGGWDAALDAALDQVDQEDVVRHWPLTLAPKTRGWLDRNVLAATLSDVRASVRLEAGAPPVFGVSYDFDNAAVRYLGEMEPLTRASGRASLFDRRFVIALDAGSLDGPEGTLDMAGSVFAVRDTDETPSTVELDLAASGDVPAALAVFATPPLNFAEIPELAPENFTGTFRARSDITFRTVKDLKLKDVIIAGEAQLFDVATGALAPGKTITGQELALGFTNDGVSITGDVMLGEVPISATWRRALGPNAPPGGGQITGQATVTPSRAAEFGLRLPSEVMRGATVANFEIDLPKDTRPQARISSSLAGLTLSLPGLGWTKPSPVAGRLDAAVTLGEVPEVESLSLTAPGLSAKDMRLALTGAGRFQSLEVPALRIGDWLDAGLSVRPGADGRAEVSINGGAIDVRAMELATPGRGPDSGGAPTFAGQVRMAPDRVILSDTLSLTDVRGTLTPANGLSGSFAARVNGGTPITARIIPVPDGSAFRIASQDAGGVIRDAGFVKNGYGGTFNLLLAPLQTPGRYGGELVIEDIIVRDAPALAALLDGISIVGLLDDGGTGIRFDEVDARFRMTPDALELVQSAAVGASMGISMDGLFDLRSGRMDMQGVISPLYMLNGIGSLFTRRGEGLFGFNFRMTGDSKAPRISINPLSLFTPGMFREIFRRPAPRLDSRAGGGEGEAPPSQ
ncbi:MAG: hypothetical protein AAF871_02120 [Pseudomonadota bacterium]